MGTPITEAETAEVLARIVGCADLDFSEFHPLDHWAGTPRCHSLPGGIRNHLSLWWQFQRPGWDHGINWDE